MPERQDADTAAPCTVANLIEYLRQFNPDMVVYLDIEAAVEDGYAEDYVEQAYVSLSYALGKIEDGIPEDEQGDNVNKFYDGSLAPQQPKCDG